MSSMRSSVLPAACWRVLGSRRRRQDVGARGLWPDRRLRRRAVSHRFHAGGPFGYEERLTGAAVGPLDDPFGGIGRVSPFPVTLGAGLAKGPGTPFIMVPHDLKATRVQTWNVAVQRQLSDTIAVSATYLGSRGHQGSGATSTATPRSCRRILLVRARCARRRERRRFRIAPPRPSTFGGTL